MSAIRLRRATPVDIPALAEMEFSAFPGNRIWLAAGRHDTPKYLRQLLFILGKLSRDLAVAT